MTNVYIVRHAEAEGNVYRRIQGQENSRITHNGERQVRALQKRFEGVQVDAVYASDLYRACRTAQAISVPKGLPIHKDARFREVKLGVWESLPFGYLEEFDAERMRVFSKEPELWQVEGSENYEQYTDRFLGGLIEAAEENDGKTIAIVTHGLVSTGSIRRIFKDQLHQAGRCDNTGVSLITYENGGFQPVYFYDNSHLTEEISTLAHQKWWRGKRDFNLWYRDAEAADRALFDPAFAPVQGHRVQIAYLRKTPVGYLSFDGKSASCLYLLPEYRHQRMGDQLLGQVVFSLRAQGRKELQIGVPTCLTEALSFFTRQGASITQMDDAYTVFRMDIGIPEY